jgi:hypothetical protein
LSALEIDSPIPRVPPVTTAVLATIHPLKNILIEEAGRKPHSSYCLTEVVKSLTFHCKRDAHAAADAERC